MANLRIAKANIREYIKNSAGTNIDSRPWDILV